MKAFPTHLRHKMLLACSLCAALALSLLFSVPAFALEGDEGADNDTLVGFVDIDAYSDLDGDQADTPAKTEDDIPADPIDPVDPIDTEDSVDPGNPGTDVYYFDKYEARLSWVDSNQIGPMFGITRSVDDEECFNHFISLSIDGVELERDVDYKASFSNAFEYIDGEFVYHDEGTLITLYAAPLKAIGPGEHTVTALFDDGSFSIALTIIAYEDWYAEHGEGVYGGMTGYASENASPEAATGTTDPAPQAAAPAQNVPATGDASANVSALLLAALAALACADAVRVLNAHDRF